MKYKILFITTNYPLSEVDINNGGRGSFFIPLIKKLTSKGYLFTVVTTNRKGDIALNETMHGSIGEKIYLFDSNLKNFNNLSIFNPLDLIRLFKFIASYWKTVNGCIKKEEKFDLVILAWGIPTGILLLNRKLRNLSNAIWWLGTDYNKFNTLLGRQLLKIISKLTDINLFNSKSMMINFREKINKNVEFAPLTNLDYKKEIKLIRKETKVINILSIGNLLKVKGFDIAIDAITTLIDNGYNIEYNIIGEGEERKFLHKKISSYHEKIRLLGKIDDSEKNKMIQNCQIFLIPSRSEGMPLTFFEALEYDKIICSTKVGDIENIIKDSNIGIIIPQKTKISISKTLENLILNPMEFSLDDKKNIFNDYTINKTVNLIETRINKHD